jgi:hypothetical protein
MGQGLQVFNADGSLQFDSSIRLGRLYGKVLLPAGGGSIVTDDIGSNTPWFVRWALGADDGPSVTFKVETDGISRLRWTVNPNSIDRDMTCTYGTY